MYKIKYFNLAAMARRTAWSHAHLPLLIANAHVQLSIHFRGATLCWQQDDDNERSAETVVLLILYL